MRECSGYCCSLTPPAATVALWAEHHQWRCDDALVKRKAPDYYACGQAYLIMWEHSRTPDRLAFLPTLLVCLRFLIACAHTVQLRIFVTQSAAATSPLYAWHWVDTLFMSLGTWYGYGRATREETLLWNAAFARYNATVNGGPTGSAAEPGLWDPSYSLFLRDKVLRLAFNSEG